MDRSTLLKLMHKFNKFIIFINKHFYILSFSAWLFNNISLLKNNKLVYSFYNLIKIILFFTIILSVGIIAYFTDLNTPFNNTFSMYYDLLEPYIEILKHFYNKVIDYFNNIISLSHQSRGIDKDTILNQLNIENEIKSGVKSGIKEALEEVVEDMENESKLKSDYLIKNIIVASSVLFAIYLFIYLPGSDATSVDIAQYNSLNQLFINLKLTVIDLISGKPGNPGTPGIGGNNISPVINSVSPPSTPISPTYSSYFKSPASVSEYIPTITPNTPVASTSTLVNTVASTMPQVEGVINNASTISSVSPVISANGITVSESINTVPTVSQYLEKEVGTVVDGRTVGKMVETIDMLQRVLNEESADMLKDHANNTVKNLWD